MVKVGDKVKIEAVRNGGLLAKVHDVVTVTEQISDLGSLAFTASGVKVYVCYDFDNSCADYLAGSIVMAEAERRGAKFGVMGVDKNSGGKVIFLADGEDKNAVGEVLWTCFVKESRRVVYYHPNNIRLDHEPEFIPWVDAPEELKWEASRVYCDDHPVKWISKPDGSNSGVAYVDFLGTIMGSASRLTVKL